MKKDRICKKKQKEDVVSEITVSISRDGKLQTESIVPRSLTSADVDAVIGNAKSKIIFGKDGSGKTSWNCSNNL